LRISTGEHGMDVLNVYGDQLLEESRPGLVTADFTMVFSDIDMFEHTFGAATSVGTTGFSRISGADKTGSRTAKAILFTLSNSNKGTIYCLLNNAYFTSSGEITLAADGRAEWTGTAVCKISDFYIEDNF